MQTREMDLYKTIYDAAIKGEQATLAAIIAQHKSLDVKGKIGLFTPAARLAAEGKDKAVALLQSFGANPDFIAMGYVYAGQITYAEKMRREQGIKIHFLALGAGLACDKSYANYLLKSFQLSPEYLVLGATINGNDEWAESFMHHDLDDDVYLRCRLAQLNAVSLGNAVTRSHRAAVIYERSLEKLEDDVSILQAFVNSSPTKIFQYHQVLQKIGACGAGGTHYCLREWRGLQDSALQSVKPDTILLMMDVCGFVHSEYLLTYELVFSKNPTLIQQLNQSAQRQIDEFGMIVPSLREPFIHACFKQFNRCATRAIKMLAVMQELHFDYDAAYAFVVNPAMRDLLHLAMVSQGNLHANATIECLMAKVSAMPIAVCRTMLHQYLDWSARFILDASLKHFYQQNYSSVDPRYWVNNNLDRSESMRLAAKNANSEQIYGWMMLQFGLFNGTINVVSDSTKSRHEQPLSRPNPDSGFFKVIKEMVESPRFKILSGK